MSSASSKLPSYDNLRFPVVMARVLMFATPLSNVDSNVTAPLWTESPTERSRTAVLMDNLPDSITSRMFTSSGASSGLNTRTDEMNEATSSENFTLEIMFPSKAVELEIIPVEASAVSYKPLYSYGLKSPRNRFKVKSLSLKANDADRSDELLISPLRAPLPSSETDKLALSLKAFMRISLTSTSNEEREKSPPI
ncbi:MAG: hypothetical protein J5800_00105 [Spirochaetales bacterium]|nr:hypothetical protein [Spirochaetales bacterium]